ncbi:Serine 3-dehydrogenase [Aquicella siphonis]|uniref:Serine 3-dehydrogenase n=1 Tax=Aquicella siphonis TaxID=254247 RepID=A0A5E4PJ67_9COXI|nr:SDR family oxidoreductase [Aquicella siphonis]VVC76391.1 Serine 3-dehydrogenase [Aquicella siphonis]
MFSVVITGVSTGIGHASAKLFANRGIHVFGSLRNESDARRLQHEFGSHFTPLIFDVTDESSVHSAARQTAAYLQGKKLWGLINNAGMAVTGALTTMPVKEFQKQLDVNLTGQLIVIQAFAPLLGVDKSLAGQPGKIINISSVSGKNAYPFLGAYAASKHGLEALSESLRRELMLYGIDVVIVAPGAIKTAIWDKARQQTIPEELSRSDYARPARVFKEYILQSAEKSGLPAETVANLLLHILQSRRPKTRYAPVPQKFFNWTLPNLLPRRWVDWLIAKKLGLLPDNTKRG